MYVFSETSIVVGFHAAFSNVFSVLTPPPCPPLIFFPVIQPFLLHHSLYPLIEKGSISPLLKAPPY